MNDEDNNKNRFVGRKYYIQSSIDATNLSLLSLQ